MPKELYVFGDSFSAPFLCVNPKDSFWGLAAKDLNIDTIYNYSWYKNCLENIVHTILNEEFDYENGYFIIGIPPLVRASIYIESKDSKIVDDKELYKFDNIFNSSNLEVESLKNVSNWPFNEAFTNEKEYVSYFRAEWRDVLALEQIYLLACYLKSMNAKFMIVNEGEDIHYQESWPAGKEIMQKVKNLDNCFMYADSYHDLNIRDKIKPADFKKYGWAGHHGPEGNLNWYNKHIKLNMINLGWISI
jgi:hypothetical protein